MPLLLAEGEIDPLQVENAQKSPKRYNVTVPIHVINQ
jgi:hypothetical protein